MLVSKELFLTSFVKLLAFIAACLIIFNICLNIFVYASLLNVKGKPGPKGIPGSDGKKGKNGICTATCGQKVCNKKVIDSVNDYLVSKKLKFMKNKFMIEKISKICNSDKYIGFLNSDDKNTPIEKDLIEYIVKSLKEWIDIILKHEYGSDFLNKSEYDLSFFDSNNSPFQEITKYDIWNWGDSYKFKPIIRQQCSNKENLPEISSELEILYTNNYDLVFTNKSIEDKYGPDNTDEDPCPFNQLGDDFTNPRNIVSCFYDKNSKLKTKPVWKKIEFMNYKYDISFYNVKPIKINNKQFYPLASVWSGSNETTKPKKETILVCDRGEKNLQKPKKFVKIWSNVDFDETLDIDPETILIDVFTIWRPIPTEGYVSMGDFVSKGIQPPNLDSVRCIKKDLVEPYDVSDENVWNEYGFKINLKKTEKSKVKQCKLKPVSIFPIGITNKDEEIKNIGHKKIQDIKEGGYNLFRTSDTASHKPLENTRKSGYIIKPSAYNVTKTNDPSVPNNDLGIGWLGGKLRDPKYSVFTNLEYTPKGIILSEDKSHKYFIEYEPDNNIYFVSKSQDSKFAFLNAKLMEDESEKKWINIENTNMIKDNENYHWSINKIEKDDNSYKVNIVSKFNGKFLTEDIDLSSSSSNTWIFLPSTGI